MTGQEPGKATCYKCGEIFNRGEVHKCEEPAEAIMAENKCATCEKQVSMLDRQIIDAGLMFCSVACHNRNKCYVCGRRPHPDDAIGKYTSTGDRIVCQECYLGGAEPFKAKEGFKPVAESVNKVMAEIAERVMPINTDTLKEAGEVMERMSEDFFRKCIGVDFGKSNRSAAVQLYRDDDGNVHMNHISGLKTAVRCFQCGTMVQEGEAHGCGDDYRKQNEARNRIADSVNKGIVVLRTVVDGWRTRPSEDIAAALDLMGPQWGVVVMSREEFQDRHRPQKWVDSAKRRDNVITKQQYLDELEQISAAYTKLTTGDTVTVPKVEYEQLKQVSQAFEAMSAAAKANPQSAHVTMPIGKYRYLENVEARLNAIVEAICRRSRGMAALDTLYDYVRNEVPDLWERFRGAPDKPAPKPETTKTDGENIARAIGRMR